MNGNKYLADTNILLYLIAGNSGVIDYLIDQFYISEIIEIELLGSKGITELQYDSRKKVINSCTITSISENIKRLTIQLKQTYTLKIPDAIIATTSIYLNLPLLTADKDFKKIREVNLSIIQPH
jgi:predicted nucleic acid-binding protein